MGLTLKHIPFSHGRYYVSKEGLLYDSSTKTFVDADTKIDGEEAFSVLTTDVLPQPVTRIFLVAYAFLPPAFHPSNLLKCKVIRAAGSEKKISPTKLIWVFPPEGIPVPSWPGFYFIPGFTRYAVTRSGEFLSLGEGEIKKVSRSETGYANVGLSPDGRPYIGSTIHRLLALTFIPYGSTVLTDVVNHKDGDRSNDDIANLEWSTQSDNLKHGNYRYRGYIGTSKESEVPKQYLVGKVNVGGFKDAKEVEVMDVVTGTIFPFKSVSLAAVHMGVTTHVASKRLIPDYPHPLISSRFIIRVKDGKWPEYGSPSDYSFGSGKKRTLVTRVSDQSTQVFVSAAAAIKELGLSKKVVTTSLRRNDNRIINGYTFKYIA